MLRPCPASRKAALQGGHASCPERPRKMSDSPSAQLGVRRTFPERQGLLAPSPAPDWGVGQRECSNWQMGSIDAESVEKVQFPSHTPRRVSGFRPLGSGLRSASLLAPVAFTSFDSHLCTLLFKKPFQARSAPSTYTLTALPLTCRQGTQEPNPIPPHYQSRRKTRNQGSGKFQTENGFIPE